MSERIHLVLNGHAVDVDVDARELLIELLRERLGQAGVREGCGKGECGACTVLVDGRAVNACLYPALEIDGRSVTTIEGLGDGRGGLSELQQSFVQQAAIQCGFCTPGMILSATALLAESPQPSVEEIRGALTGNLCRCTGYVQIVAAIQKAAERSSGERP